MILLRPNTTAMLFVALGMISALALPVPNDINDHSVQAQGENSKSMDRRSPMDGPSPLPHPSANIQPVPKESQMSPSTTGPQSKPMRLPPVAIPPSFPEDVQVQLYQRTHKEPTWKAKIDLLKKKTSFWGSIDRRTRINLESVATVRQKPERKKLFNAYLILAYNKELVLAQIEWIKQTDFYRSDETVKVRFDASIGRVSQLLPNSRTGYGRQLNLQPDDMIVLGLADPHEEFFGHRSPLALDIVFCMRISSYLELEYIVPSQYPSGPSILAESSIAKWHRPRPATCPAQLQKWSSVHVIGQSPATQESKKAQD
ncbi:hypothetical protein EV360DRAFT_72695 [Lentinula raphanica]|nr:hypothetical protein EV360DRAFT_72695 [Lentinula raphanica]